MMEEKKKVQLEKLLEKLGYPPTNTIYTDLEELFALKGNTADDSLERKMMLLIDYIIKKKCELNVDDGYTNKKEITALFRIMGRELKGSDHDFFIVSAKGAVISDLLDNSYKNAMSEIRVELKARGDSFKKKGKLNFTYPDNYILAKQQPKINVVDEVNSKKTRARKEWQDDLIAHSRNLFISPQWIMKGDKRRKNPIIDFGSDAGMKKAVFIPTIYEAIRDEKVLRMVYKSQFKKRTTSEFHPYLLRQYNNRWYVIGLARYRNGKEYADDIKAVDGIVKLTTLKVSYIPPKKNYLAYFEDFVGLSFKKGGVKTTIEFITNDARVHNYLLTLPFHSSQTEMKRFDGREGRFSIEVIPNEELHNKLLSFGPSITVVEPSWYFSKMLNTLEKMDSNYRQYLKNDVNGENSGEDGVSE